MLYQASPINSDTYIMLKEQRSGEVGARHCIRNSKRFGVPNGFLVDPQQGRIFCC